MQQVTSVGQHQCRVMQEKCWVCKSSQSMWDILHDLAQPHLDPMAITTMGSPRFSFSTTGRSCT